MAEQGNNSLVAFKMLGPVRLIQESYKVNFTQVALKADNIIDLQACQVRNGTGDQGTTAEGQPKNAMQGFEKFWSQIRMLDEVIRHCYREADFIAYESM